MISQTKVTQKNSEDVLKYFSDDEPDKPALNLKEHLKGLINKVDGLNGDADGGDEPKFEAISSDEDDDDQPAHFGGISLGKTL